MNFCPKCGTAREVRFCTRCGFAFEDQTAGAPTTTVTVVNPQSTSLKFGDGYSEHTHCANCGNPKESGALSCPLCKKDF
jgi:uncharacterized membrane protein YvbJ